MMPRCSVPTLALVLVAAAIGCRQAAAPAPPPATVIVATVERRDLPVVLQATGTVEPAQTAGVAAQVDGIIERVTFREGDDVEAGQVLFQVDPRPYRAALAQARAMLARDVAEAANAERDRQRFEDLAAKEFVTAQQVDQARATAAALEATLQADSAAVDRARLDLERATVRAPIAGRAGGLLVRAGNLVRANSSQPLVQINQIAPILVRFAVPATELAAIRRAGAGLPVRAVPVGDTTSADSGSLVFVDNAVDSMTGTILLKARFPNRDRALWPGALVRVALTVTVDRNAMMVPISAVLTGQQGAAVFVVGDSERVKLRPVTVVRTTDSLAVLSAGVAPGDRVVVSGQVRITDGMRVQVIGGAAAPVSIAELFIRRPVMTTLVMAGILVFGLAAYRNLPVSDLPAIDYPTISVNASLPGASPETMASSVATPLEKQFSTIAGLDALTSSSGQGTTSITLQFALDRDIDDAAADVQAAIAQSLRQLPQNMVPPSYSKVDPSASPILYYALTSASLPLSALDEYGQTLIGQRLSTVEGVAQVQVYGSQKYAVRVQLDPQALAARGIGLDEVTKAIASGNVNLPSGILWGTDRAYAVQAEGQLTNAAAFRPLVVAYRNGVPVRLRDLGRVVDSVQDTKAASWFNGTRAIVLTIQRQPGTNTVAVAARVRGVMAQIEKQLPAAVQVETLYDRSETIEESVHEVKFTLYLTLCLVVLTIFLFLRNLSATVIPSLALPMSLVGTFAVMYLLGYSLDNLSLMALTLSVGFVVDDAIVMLENVVRHMEMGKSARQAALDGAKEIGFTIVSMTLSLVAVFIPLLFLGGLIGRLFREFAVTISVSILVSGFVSLTLTPMLASRFLKPGGHAGHGRLYNATERIYNGAVRHYLTSLDWVMTRRRAALVTSGVIFAATVWLAVLIPKGFLPSEDTAQLRGTTEASEGTSFDAMVTLQQQAAAIVQRDSSIAGFMSALGGGRSSVNQGRFFIHLKPRRARDQSADDIARALSGRMSSVPGLRVFFQNPPPISIGGRSTKSLYQYTVQGPDIAVLYETAVKLQTRFRELPQLRDVTSDLQIKNPEVRVRIDRERAAAYGLTVSQVQQALYDAYGARQVSTIYTATNQYWVVLELLPQYQRDLGALSLIGLRSSSGALVPLSALAEVTPDVGPLTVNHSGQLPSVTLSFDLVAGTSIGQAVKAVEAAAAPILPASTTAGFAGTAQAFRDSQQGLLLLLVLAIVVIYIVLGILYESFVHPLTILSGLPFAGFGALVTLMIAGLDLSVYAFVGIILLVGLVKKNAIMMIDFASEAERNAGKSPHEAILEASAVRFRPIMMTTFAALLGTLPIAFATGTGAESRRPLGLAVVGGLLFSQLITLYVTPVVYTVMADLGTRWKARRGRTVGPAVLAPAEAPLSPDG